MSRVAVVPASNIHQSNPLIDDVFLADVVRPDLHQLDLKVEHYIKSELDFKLDKGEHN